MTVFVLRYEVESDAQTAYDIYLSYLETNR